MKGLRIIIIGLIALMISGCATYSGNAMTNSSDPWQAVNRPVFAVNDTFDKMLFKPLAKGYDALTPDPVQNSITNFFSNLGEIDNAINNLFQGKPVQFATSIGRLAINSTVGIAGLFDVAAYVGLERAQEDLCQTFGTLGMQAGPYVVLPLLGSSSIRDIPGRIVSMYINPLSWLDDVSFRNIMVGVNTIDSRANLLAKEDIASEISNDKYTLYRDSFLEERDFQISDGNLSDSDLIPEIAE